MLTLKNTFQLATAMLLPALLMGCRAGGGITSTPAQTPYVVVIEIPTIAVPTTTPYYSKNDLLTITGLCMTGYAVTISGDASETQTCANSSYTFNVLKLVDGLYSFQITQTGDQKTTSVPAPLVWVKKTSVSAPLLTSPSASPFASAQAALSIVGGCDSGATLSLSGDAAGSTLCVNSAFSFNIPKLGDGDYNIQVTQTDRAGNVATTPLVWKKYAVTVSPNNPSLVVGTNQLLTLGGGTGTYSVAIITNNSGGSYNSITKTYTTGTTAGVVDTLQIQDSLGANKSLTISTVAGAADHLTLPAMNGDSQVKQVGSVYDEPLAVQVVDRYGNGIPNYQLYFQTVAGDARILGSPVRTTNAQGIASATMRAGYQSHTNSVFISPLSGSLPDLAATGKSTLSMVQTASSSGKGAFGMTFAVGPNPSQFVTVDINSDGFKDLAVINGDRTISLLTSKGNGLFNTATKITGVCNGASGITAADFNADGRPDLVLACGGNDTISIYTGRGDGTFNAANSFRTDPNATRPTAIVAADFDKDGKIDIAIASGGGAVVATMQGQGDGTFLAPVAHTVGLSPTALIAVDMNRDGNLDLVVSDTADNTVRILNGDGAFGFSVPIVVGTGVGPISIVAADFTGDMWPDLAVTHNAEDAVAIYPNDGTGGLDAPNPITVGSGPNSLAVADFDKDGSIDLAVLNGGESTLSILHGSGTGLLSAGSMVPVVSAPSFIAVQDLNGDTNSDILVSGNGFVEVVPTEANASPGFASNVGINPTMSVVGHFDSDAYQDMAVLNNNSKTVSILLGKGNGFYTAKANLATGNNPSAIAMHDLNYDGHEDLVVTNQDSATARIYLGVGDGTFALGVDYTTASGPSSLVIQDFNHDGKLDLAVACINTSRISLLLGNGDGTFQTKIDFNSGSTPGTAPMSIAAVDLDGDNVLDLVTANNSSNDVSVIIGNGNGTFRTPVEYASGFGVTTLLTGDFNADGKNDVAVLNNIDGTISILRGNGDGSLQTHLDYSCGPTPNGLISGDFNGDGRVDLAVGNGSSTGFTVLIGNGNGAFNTSFSFATDYSVGGLSVGDANGDGALDLVILDSAQSKARVWMGH